MRTRRRARGASAARPRDPPPSRPRSRAARASWRAGSARPPRPRRRGSGGRAPCGASLSARGGSGSTGSSSVERVGGKSRQVAVEGAAPARLAHDLDVAAALLDDPVRAGEPEARALADALGREEGVEDPVADLAGHPAALILDREDDVPSGLELEAAEARRRRLRRSSSGSSACRLRASRRVRSGRG